MAKAKDEKGSNRPKLALHVPEPRYRPGDDVGYSDLDVGEAIEASVEKTGRCLIVH